MLTKVVRNYMTYILPLHISPSPVRPLLHEHSNEPNVFVHVAFVWQIDPDAHSLMSVIKN